MKAKNMMAGFGFALLIGGVALAQAPETAIDRNSLPGGFRGANVKDARLGDIRVIATSAVRIPLDAVAAAAEKAVGKHIVWEYGSARGNLRDQILAGQDFEVAVLLPDVDADLVKAGKIMPEEHEIASIPIAFAIRGDAKVDLSTPAAVKRAFLAAKSIKYAPTGAALLTVKKVFSTLGIADKIKDSSKLKNAVPLEAGEYEINIYPLSEIIPRKDIRNLGPVIPALQVPSVLMATIGSNANDRKAAMALIKFLQGPAIDASLKSDGMDKVAAK